MSLTTVVHRLVVLTLHFLSPFSYYLATSADDSVVKLWDLRKLKNFKTITLEDRFEVMSSVIYTKLTPDYNAEQSFFELFLKRQTWPRISSYCLRSFRKP